MCVCTNIVIIIKVFLLCDLILLKKLLYYMRSYMGTRIITGAVKYGIISHALNINLLRFEKIKYFLRHVFVDGG